MSTQQATIEKDKTNETSDAQSTEKKKSAFDLAKLKDDLDRQLDELLAESHGEVNEEIDELLGSIDDLKCDIEDKVKAYQYVKTKLEEEIEAWDARQKYHKSEAKKRRDTRNARKNNLDTMKGRVSYLLSKLEGESIRIDGKKVYNRTYYKVNIKDEELAYESLRQAGLADKEFVIDQAEQASVLEALKIVEEQAVDTDSQEPVEVTLDPETIAGIKQSISILSNLSGKIKFAGGRDLNAHAKELCQTADQKTEKLQKELVGLREEKNRLRDDLSEEELNQYDERLSELHEKIDKIKQTYRIKGAEIEISKTPFGL